MFKLDQAWHRLYQASPYAAKNIMASVYAYWSGRKKYRGVYQEWCRFLEETRSWNAQQLLEYQRARLRELVLHARKHSPWYADLMNAYHVDPHAHDIIGEIRKLPLTNKILVRENHARIRTADARNKRLVFTTSGTTGASLKVPVTEEALQREYAFRWHYHGSAAGALRTDRFAYFTGHSIVPVESTRPPFHIRNFAENSIMFSLYHMSDATIHSYAEPFNRFAPSFVFGYPSGIHVFAGFIQNNGIKLAPPRAVFTSSEKLHDFQRAQIEKVFNAPVFEWYGQVELTVNLQECSHHRLHVMENYGYLEILKEDGTDARPGEMGSAVATAWANRAFPLFRYDTGDNLRLAPDQHCGCGRSGRIIQEIIGRDDDVIVTPEGAKVVALGWVFHALESIREGQIIQEEINTIVIKLVPLGTYRDSDGDLVAAKLRQRVGPSMNIRVETVPMIERSANGKFRYVISRVRDTGATGS